MAKTIFDKQFKILNKLFHVNLSKADGDTVLEQYFYTKQDGFNMKHYCSIHKFQNENAELYGVTAFCFNLMIGFK